MTRDLWPEPTTKFRPGTVGAISIESPFRTRASSSSPFVFCKKNCTPLEVVVERHFGERGVDEHLQGRAIYLA